jgi:hypothetical protein
MMRPALPERRFSTGPLISAMLFIHNYKSPLCLLEW